jgi:putative membrane protein
MGYNGKRCKYFGEIICKSQGYSKFKTLRLGAIAMNKYWVLIILFFIGLIWSGISPHDYFTWFLEIFPAIAGFFILVSTFKKFRFSDLTYFLIFVHCCILFIGGHYSYAEVPLFNWIKEVFDQSRNNYDKVGHFAQGFVPAFITREIFIRKKIVKPGTWLSFMTICVCVTISVCYEFIEWFVAVMSGQSAEAFLGTQGYVWDTQSDMLFATIGSICMILFMSRIHDRQILKIETTV